MYVGLNWAILRRWYCEDVLEDNWKGTWREILPTFRRSIFLVPWAYNADKINFI